MESQWCSSSTKANRLKTQEEPNFQLDYKIEGGRGGGRGDNVLA